MISSATSTAPGILKVRLIVEVPLPIVMSPCPAGTSNGVTLTEVLFLINLI
jgi:uncharacterized membrane protein